ncbi:sulfurtransferase [Paenibacillus sp. WQ 127069]|uniref:Sulfurtransferase n=1 Tax=Paenibacillus baimaensis TaxID=2982185 RepID=A0ABT2ULR8_9BACL|nr:sulfurtransferase [Paenibacillus sp. WQ 127069]MCU6795583.1 sulfurtransferase [Paenibacillus sp. WQ 127069]
MSNIVNVDWVRSRILAGDTVVADVRFSPKEPLYGKEAYERGHLPGAVFVDFKRDLTDSPKEHGGRSPIPSSEDLAKTFGNLGIDRSTTVVVYEDVNGPAASRLWWLLKYVGVEDVRILDGGYEAWVQAGQSVTSEQPTLTSRTLEPIVQEHLLADVNAVRAAIETNGIKLVDSRDSNQYLGLEAPFDPIAGHIPSALNYFWKDGLEQNGNWKSPEELKAHFAGLEREEEIIVYCGSGISATPNVLALQEAGFTNVKLYAGSWSDWISYKDNPIAVGEK